MSSGTLTRGPAAPGRGQLPTPMDPRLRARRHEVARHEGRRRLRRLLAVGVVASLVIGVVGLLRSTALDVDQITVAGATHTGAPGIRDAAGIPTGRAMISVDEGAAAARLEELPWVADATVTRAWPGTVRIEVVERRAVAVLGRGNGAVVVDRSGRVLGPAEGSDLPVAGPDPLEGIGEQVSPARRSVVRLLADLPDDLRADVERGTVSEAGVGLVLRDGIEVHLCDGTRLAAKSDNLRALLAQADRPTIDTIDLCIPSAPALTRLPTGGA